MYTNDTLIKIEKKASLTKETIVQPLDFEQLFIYTTVCCYYISTLQPPGTFDNAAII